MSFVDSISNYRSLSIVGMEKNTGKTETLNYLLGHLQNSPKTIAVTSIGIDGEGIDQVTSTAKPEITLYENMLFVTSEKHYQTKQLTSEVLDISNWRTSLGRLITARVKTKGKVLLSGPADTATLQNVIQSNRTFGTDLTIVDGALSRLSTASPSVTEAMILTTGAALSANIADLVKQTKYVCNLVALEEADEPTKATLVPVDKGIQAIDEKGLWQDVGMPSALSFTNPTAMLTQAQTIFIGGALGNKFLEYMRMQKNVNKITLIVQDFTKIFADLQTYYAFIQKGGQIKVLHKTNLLAITINPTSPQGYTIKSGVLQQALAEAVNVPVFNIREL